jgi:hypothetical protein
MNKTRNSNEGSSIVMSSLVDQLCAIERLGDVYEKKRRLKELKERIEGVDTRTYDDIMDRIAQQDLLVDGLLDTEDEGSRPEEVVGDIDDLLRGMTLDDGGEEEVGKAKVVYVKPGRRYKRVVRQGGGGGVQLVKHRGGSACSGDDVHGGVGPSNHGTCDDDNKMMGEDKDEDEEKKRYGMVNKNTLEGNTMSTKKNVLLSVDIPVAGDVLVKAANRGDGVGLGNGSSGSTHACDVVDVRRNGGESSGDESSDGS